MSVVRCLPVLFALVAFLATIRGDIYLDNPRGSNNKLNEQSNTVSNRNRLFDSQDNDNSGYQHGDNCNGPCFNPGTTTYNAFLPGAGQGVMQFYTGSYLQITWLNQHGCGTGNGNLNCDIILQYMCSDTAPGLRDGYITTTINTTFPNDPMVGQHETASYYTNCANRQRNGGLFLADQNLGCPNATCTRQNPNGNNNRHGFECPEERDYYPYWGPTPWRDIAILTTDLSRCSYYQQNSQNVANKGNCSIVSYITQKSCVANGGTWSMVGAYNMPPPDCIMAPYSRTNQNGNAPSNSNMDLGPMSYNWTVPSTPNAACVIRIRYNTTSNDMPAGYDGFGLKGMMLNAQFNGALSPVKTSDTQDFVGLGSGTSGPLRLAINTNQFGRTFQDRTHVFSIVQRPSSVPDSATLWNLNVRGRRGNIVEVYPSVEYDWTPSPLVLSPGDYVHLQWTGADSNQLGQAGQGTDGTDRSNFVMMSNRNVNYPSNYMSNTLFGDPNDANVQSRISLYAYQNQTNCQTGQNSQSVTNCAYINSAPAYFNGGVFQVNNPGTFHYISTRNNEFTNRDQKGTIIVLTPPNYVAIILTSVLGALVLGYITTGVIARSMYTSGFSQSCCIRYTFCIPFIPPRTGQEEKEEKNQTEEPNKFQQWWDENVAAITILFTYFLANVGLMLYGFWSNYTTTGSIYFPVAKMFGVPLNFNVSLILFPILRNILSWIRMTPVGEIIPVDSALTFHKIIATVIALFGILHTVFHFLNAYWMQANMNVSLSTYMVSLPGLTGFMVAGLMFIMFVTAPAYMRRGRWSCCGKPLSGYDIFWWCHYMYIPVLALMVLHGPRFWMWLFYPLMLLILERLIRYYRAQKFVDVVGVTKLSSGVLKVEFRTRNFVYKPGQYLYLNAPEIAKNEWHPFTITSCPEEDTVHVHMRQVGDWTKAFADAFCNNPSTQIKTPEHRRSLLAPETSTRGLEMPTVGGIAGAPVVNNRLAPPGLISPTDVTVTVPPRNISPAALASASLVSTTPVQGHHRLKVDGPYGSASEYVFNYDIVMLVGAGIGVTPFASIMRSIKMRSSCSHCDAGRSAGAGRPTKVYFYWVCRDKQEFNWFSSLIVELEHDASLGHRFEFNTFVTGEMTIAELSSGGRSGGFSMKYTGRPNWRRIMKEISDRHNGNEIGVFYCGPPPLAKEVAASCKQFSEAATKTKFVFRKENF